MISEYRYSDSDAVNERRRHRCLTSDTLTDCSFLFMNRASIRMPLLKEYRRFMTSCLLSSDKYLVIRNSGIFLTIVS